LHEGIKIHQVVHDELVVHLDNFGVFYIFGQRQKVVHYHNYLPVVHIKVRLHWKLFMPLEKFLNQQNFILLRANALVFKLFEQDGGESCISNIFVYLKFDDKGLVGMVNQAASLKQLLIVFNYY
jgi:hypothetical protein